MKKAAAEVNKEYGLDAKLAEAIMKAADDVGIIKVSKRNKTCSLLQ